MVQPIPFDDFENSSGEELPDIHEGCVLLARESLEDPNFKSSVVLICIYNTDGAFGLVLNRPSHMPLAEVFNVDMARKIQKRKMYIGGPVQQDSLQIVQITDSPVQNTYEFCPGVHLGGEWEDIEQILDADENSTRLFLGYSGWGPNQLETEINAGTWDVFPVDVARLLTGPEEKLFHGYTAIREYLETLTL